MFNDRFGLTDAVLEGRKTVTRRIVNIKDCSESHKHYNGADWKDEPMRLINDGVGCYCALCGNGVSPKNKYCGIPLPYQVGEVVAIAQQYKNIIDKLLEPNGMLRVWIPESSGYNNKMFVKSELMPHKIEILDVRVERLQDITDEDCIKEGISSCERSGNNYIETIYGIDMINKFIELGKTPREAFASLIDKISGKGTWESNPYIFRYEFKLK